MPRGAGRSRCQPGDRRADRDAPGRDAEDLDAALEAAKRGFKTWKATSTYDRYKILRKAADLMRERAETIAKIMTLEQGKPFPEAKMEVLGGADTIDWFAEEGRRAYGRVIPAPRRRRAADRDQRAGRAGRRLHAVELPDQPGGPQGRRRRSRAGCSVILKAPEETPARCAELVRAFLDAGVPATSSASSSASRRRSRST